VKKISVPVAPTSVNELVQPFINAITPNTKLIAFSHLSNVSGLTLPAKEICQMAKARGIMTLVDGAQIIWINEYQCA
jgi:isopenicillin-N epimerase